MIHEEKAQGKTIFMSSHVMSEVEATCDRVGIIREGQTGHNRHRLPPNRTEPLDRQNYLHSSLSHYDTFNNLPGITVADQTDNRTYNLSISGEGCYGLPNQNRSQTSLSKPSKANTPP